MIKQYLALENKKYEDIAEALVKAFFSSQSVTVRDLLGVREYVILCGASGAGKSRSIEVANVKLLPAKRPKGRDEQIAECADILKCTDSENAITTLLKLSGVPPRYQDCRYEVFSLLSVKTGKALQQLVSSGSPETYAFEVIFCDDYGKDAQLAEFLSR